MPSSAISGRPATTRVVLSSASCSASACGPSSTNSRSNHPAVCCCSSRRSNSLGSGPPCSGRSRRTHSFGKYSSYSRNAKRYCGRPYRRPRSPCSCHYSHGYGSTCSGVCFSLVNRAPRTTLRALSASYANASGSSSIIGVRYSSSAAHPFNAISHRYGCGRAARYSSSH